MQMTRIVVTEKAIREYLREAMHGIQHAGAFDEAPVNTSDVVDPSAAITDPDDDDFRPKSRQEFKTALSSMVDDINDSDAPEAYDAVVGALDDLKSDEDDMSTEDKVEEAVRLAVRKMVSEAWTKGPHGEEIWTDETPKKAAPKKGKPAPGPVTGKLPPVKKLPPEAHGGEFTRGVERYKKDLRKSLKTWDDSSEDERVDPEAPAAGRGRKNKMMTDVGGASFKEMAAELGFASESGAKQAVERIMAKAQFLQNMDETEQEILVLTAMQDYIEELASAGQLTPADVQLMKDHPTIVSELDTFRVYLAKYVKKAMKAASMGESKEIALLRRTIRKEISEAMTSGLENSDKPRRKVPSPKGPTCADCGKALTPADKSSYEAEGGSGYPEVCEDCAEMP
jgi:hypothetical protein